MADVMSGGAGEDIFVFAAMEQSPGQADAT